ncbi:MAG: type 1 glutamine amidotransferase domain-containing protein [Thiohalophilus sp.]
MSKLVFIVGEGFEDSEFQVPYEYFKKAGHEIDVMGAEAGVDVHGKRDGVAAHIDRDAGSAYPDEYDAMVIPGGFGPDRLRTNQAIVDFIKGFTSTGKPVAAICHGPQLLIEADEVQGRTLTSWPSVRTDLLNAGAVWVDDPVVVDGNLITSRKPDDLDAFCKAIAEALHQESAQHRHQRPGGGTNAKTAPAKSMI